MEFISKLIHTTTHLFSSNADNNDYPKAILMKEFDNKWYKFMKSSQMDNYYHEDELKQKIIGYVTELSPYSSDIKVDFYNWHGMYLKKNSLGDEHTMRVEVRVWWNNGMRSDLLVNGIYQLCNQHFETIPNFQNEHFHRGEITMNWYLKSCNRSYSTDVILAAAHKYGEMIAPNFPLNERNVEMVQLAGACLKKLAIADLDKMECVNPGDLITVSDKR
jgi:hypothetical protein